MEIFLPLAMAAAVIIPLELCLKKKPQAYKIYGYIVFALCVIFIVLFSAKELVISENPSETIFHLSLNFTPPLLFGYFAFINKLKSVKNTAKAITVMFAAAIGFEGFIRIGQFYGWGLTSLFDISESGAIQHLTFLVFTLFSMSWIVYFCKKANLKEIQNSDSIN